MADEPFRPATPTTPADFDRSDWPARVADQIVDRIDGVRSKTTRRAVFATRVLVYGVALTILGGLALVLLLVALFRVSAELSDEIASQIYWAYLVWGLVLTIVGVVLLRKAAAHPDPDR